jgi:hypothetical protein
LATGERNNVIDVATIDGYLSRQGRFCLIDWLLADNFLHYADYEAWRYGELNSLDDVLQFDRQTLRALIDNTDEHCRDLGLIPERQEFFRWNDDHPVLLLASEDNAQDLALTQRWLRPGDRPQLDLFLDNSALIAENTLLEALSARLFDTAQSQLLNLSELNPDCTRLGVYQDLINYGLHMLANPEVAEEDVNDELHGLQQEVVPLVQDVMGPAARDYLAFAWRRLSNAMQGITFDPRQPWRHSSSALLKIPDYAAVIECLNADPGLYRHAILMERQAQSFGALHQHESELILWCLLMELDADYTEQALNRHQSHRAHALWQDFWDIEESWPSTLFPAYVLARQPGLLHFLEIFPALRFPASKAMVVLLRKRLAGEDEISARKDLQAISPELLKIYLQRL